MYVDNNEALLSQASAVPDSFSEIIAADIDGSNVDFGAAFANRVVLVTNVASE